MTKLLYTDKQLEALLKAEVAAAGGAKKWLRKNKITTLDHVLHMIQDGRAATLREVLYATGFVQVVRYEKAIQE